MVSGSLRIDEPPHMPRAISGRTAINNKVAIIGAKGMLGNALRKEFPEGLFLDKREDDGIGYVDVTELDSLESALSGFGSDDLVVNAVGFALVDKAETDEYNDTSWELNYFGPSQLGSLAVEQGFTAMHISTAYVFNGARGNYSEADKTGPVNTYGTHKLQGEEACLAKGGRKIILRPDVLFGPNGPSNFIDTIARLSAENGELEVVSDQVVSPTYTADLAGMVRGVAESGGSGIFHAVNTGSCSRHELAEFIVITLGRKCNVVPINTAEYNAKYREGKVTAVRPPDCSLNNSRIQSLGIEVRTWQEAVTYYLENKYPA